ncbi:hypothetical protein Btheta7330_02247 [Bacteroides thetaiotaomicron]|nr:hypothetical protein Btheta7330_02247 [Bacteroides thetaiotaomicron]
MKQKVYMIMLFLSSIIVVSCNPEKKHQVKQSVILILQKNLCKRHRFTNT